MNNHIEIKPDPPIFSGAGALLDSRLIRQTNKQLYNIKLYDCNGLIHVYEYQNTKMKINKNIEENNSYSEYDKKIIFKTNNNNNISSNNEIRLDNVMRSKLAFQRICKANANNFYSHIILTFSDNVKNLDKAHKKFNVWRTKFKKEYPDFMYIGVTEFQKRGAVHYHLLTNLKPNSKLLPLQKGKNVQYDVLYWNEGFSSAYKIKNINVVGYLSKYINETIDNKLHGRKRYFYSKNLFVPKEQYIYTKDLTQNTYLENLLKDKKIQYSNEYTNKYTLENIVFKEYV